MLMMRTTSSMFRLISYQKPSVSHLFNPQKVVVQRENNIFLHSELPYEPVIPGLYATYPEPIFYETMTKKRRHAKLKRQRRKNGARTILN